MAYKLMSSLPVQYEDANGNPLVGGTISFYINGTSTPSPVYFDVNGGSSATSVTLNSRGMPANAGTPVSLYQDTEVVLKAIIRDADGNTISGGTISDIRASLDADEIYYDDPIAPAYLKTVSDIINGVPVSIFRFMTPGQVADVQSATASIDLSTSINDAIAALGTSGRAGQLQVNGGKYLIGSTINFSTSTAVPVSLIGAGKGKTVFQRAAAFSAGDMFYLGSQGNPFSAWAELKNFSILNSGGVLNTSGYAISLEDRECVDIAGIFIYDGYGGLSLTGSTGTINIEDVFYIQSTTYATALGASDAGYRQQGTISTVKMNKCGFVAQNVASANCLRYGAYIGGCDGAQFTNCFFSGGTGILFAGGSGFNVDDAYFDNVIIDACRNTGVDLQGANGVSHVYTNIRFVDGHINPRVDSGQNTVGVAISGDCDNVQFLGVNINLCGGDGVAISNTNNWSGNPRQGIKFSSCDITGNNVNNVGGVGINIGSGVTGVSIDDCEIYNRNSTTNHAQSAITLAGTNSHIKITNNNLAPNVVAPIAFSGTGYTNIVIANNEGIDDVVTDVATAGTIDIAAWKIIHLTGTTNIATINPAWTGRTVMLYATDGAVNLTAAGNIATAETIPDEEGITLVYDGAKWRATR